MNHLLTIHIVNEVPWSNLNRDDTGLPKRMRQGGTQRGILSAQSLKHGARRMYEDATNDLSVRSANIVEIVLKKAKDLNSNLDEKQAAKEINKIIGGLTKKGASESNPDREESGRSIWLSMEEIDTLAQAIAIDQDTVDFILKGKTGSLSIAAFGRMFAVRGDLQTEAALAVSPAVSTHKTVIETDYFITGDDSPTEKQAKGATFLGISHYLNGIFYRSITIDRNQLQKSWTAYKEPEAGEKISQMVTSLIYGMPKGKKNSTAPYIAPALVLIESQAHRLAFDFEKPVSPGTEGGYLESTLKRIKKEREAIKNFDPENIAEPQAVAGTAENLEMFGLPVIDRPGISKLVAEWALKA